MVPNFGWLKIPEPKTRVDLVKTYSFNGRLGLLGFTYSIISLILFLGLDPWPLDPLDPPKSFKGFLFFKEHIHIYPYILGLYIFSRLVYHIWYIYLHFCGWWNPFYHNPGVLGLSKFLPNGKNPLGSGQSDPWIILETNNSKVFWLCFWGPNPSKNKVFRSLQILKRAVCSLLNLVRLYRSTPAILHIYPNTLYKNVELLCWRKL